LSTQQNSKRVRIRYLDGRRLRRALVAGTQNVIENQQELDAINVFPVPDGDTGTNMAATAQSILDGLSGVDSAHVREVSRAAAESALMGARGNSGVILAQFFQSLHEKLRHKSKLTTEEFGDAVYHAALQSREALANPKEGTIITVLREWADWVRQHSLRMHDFADLLRHSLVVARQSLAETPKKLEVLRKSGVVDAGAKGFVHLLEGMVEFIETGKLRSVVAGRHLVDRLRHFHFRRDDGAVGYRYCTQCMLEGEGLDKRAVRRALKSFGDSLIVIGSAERLRVHIHSDHPEQVFQFLERYGTVTARKAEDMLAQHIRATEKPERSGIGLVTDSTCDLPEEFFQRHGIRVVPLTLHIDGRTYVDREEITAERFYQMLPNVRSHPMTSQPAPGDFLRAYQEVGSAREAIVSIHISAALSGTYQNALHASKAVQDTRVAVLDSRTASVALGLIVEETAQAIEQGLPFEAVVQRARRAIRNQRIFVVLPTLTYAVRSGRVSRKKGFLGNLLGVRPIIVVTEEGKIVEAAKGLSDSHAMRKTLRMVEQFIREKGFTHVRFGVAHAKAEEKAEWYVREIERRFGVSDVLVVSASPVLGNHTGPGTAAVAVLGW